MKLRGEPQQVVVKFLKGTGPVYYQRGPRLGGFDAAVRPSYGLFRRRRADAVARIG
jgi:hypothetical protein